MLLASTPSQPYCHPDARRRVQTDRRTFLIGPTAPVLGLKNLLGIWD